MIQGVTKTEANYRAIMLDSSSSLKDFALDRKKYYRKWILNEEVEEKDTTAIIMGRLVETLLFEPHLFDNKFYMSACASPPTANMALFVEALYAHTTNATNEEGVVTRTFEELSRDAYIDSGYKISYEQVMKKFIGSDAEIFYDEIRRVRANNLTVVTTKDVTNAELIVEELKNNPVTKDIVTKVNSDKFLVEDQLQIEGYTLDGHIFKSMMDRVIIDHSKKTIQVYDLKCVWAVENFYEEYYLYRRAYIQLYLYWIAAQSYRDDNFPGYEVLCPKFIVSDSSNYYNPLIYCSSPADLEEAYKGFIYKGRNYPGVQSLIKDLNWAMDNGIWNISRENYELDGQVFLKPLVE